jgi:glycosyltransferase involved in cell wall biosynthesis
MREHVLFLPFVEEQDMPALYRGAVAVLYPTEYEGFGFPALEAQAVGTPVLFSPVGSLAELAGPGAELLPPFDLQAWTATVRRLLAGRSVSSVPNMQARAWARGFSWSECARRHLEVYEQAAVRGRRDRGDRGRKLVTGQVS